MKQEYDFYQVLENIITYAVVDKVGTFEDSRDVAKIVVKQLDKDYCPVILLDKFDVLRAMRETQSTRRAYRLANLVKAQVIRSDDDAIS